MADLATVLVLGGGFVLVFSVLGALWDWLGDRRDGERA